MPKPLRNQWSKLRQARAERWLLDQCACRPRVTVRWLDAREVESFAYVKARTIVVPHVVSGASFLVALHELGHIRDTRARRADVERDTDLGALLTSESLAWAWALNSVPEWARDWIMASDWATVPP